MNDKYCTACLVNNEHSKSIYCLVFQKDLQPKDCAGTHLNTINGVRTSHRTMDGLKNEDESKYFNLF